MALSQKQAAFVIEYIKCWNATKAAKLAGYSEKTARAIGCINLTHPGIWAAIKQHTEESAMQAHEVLARLTEHAQGDMGDFLAISPTGEISVKVTEHTSTRLIKKVTQRRKIYTTAAGQTEDIVISIELYDAQAALAHLGKHHGLFRDIVETKSEFELGIDEETRLLLGRIGGLASRIRADEGVDGISANQAGESTT